MPRAAKRLCLVCKTPCDGRVCAAHAADDPARVRDRYRGSSASRGYGVRHRNWRKLVLHRHPLCAIAVFCGGLAISTVADHIIPLSAGGDWSLENGQGGCEECHNWKRSMESRGKDWRRERELRKLCKG